MPDGHYMASTIRVSSVANWLIIVVYDLPRDILSTLTPKDEANDGPQDTLPISDTYSETASETSSVVGAKACSLCGITFHTVEEQRGHTRSDLHGYNLKQKIRGRKAVTEEEFEKLVGGMSKPNDSLRMH